MKIIIKIVLIILYATLLVACSTVSSTSQSTGSQSTATSPSLNSSSSNTVVSDNNDISEVQNQVLSSPIDLNISAEEFFTSYDYKDIVETSTEIVVVYSLNDESIIIDYFDKFTGKINKTETISAVLVENSLEYNRISDTVQLKAIDGDSYYIHTLGVNVDTLVDELATKLGGGHADSFDGTPNNPSNAWWVISNNDGIYINPVGDNPADKIFISNDIILDHPELTFTYEGAVPPYFDDVRLVNDGSVLVSTVVNQMSQSGNIALYIYNIKTGEDQFYTDVFSAMIASVDYFNEHTVITRGYDFATFFELDDNEISIIETPEFTFYYTYNYEDFFRLEGEANKRFISHFNIADESNNIVERFGNGNLYILDVTENYVFVVFDSFKCLAIPY